MVLSCRSKSVDESYQISIVLFSSFWRLTEYIFWEIIVILDNVLPNARKYHIQSILPFPLISPSCVRAMAISVLIIFLNFNNSSLS